MVGNEAPDVAAVASANQIGGQTGVQAAIGAGSDSGSRQFHDPYFAPAHAGECENTRCTAGRACGDGVDQGLSRSAKGAHVAPGGRDQRMGKCEKAWAG